ncbi:Gamma-glutamyltranspeptidase [Apiospora sp. TS-2023a]
MFALTAVTLFTLTRVTLSSFSSGLPPFPAAGSGEAKGGAVASMDARCSKAGLEILELGGNAADTAITVEFCLGVIGMYSTGIGGGGMALVRDARGHYDFLDFRETAPAASTENMLKDNVNASLWGGLASGVPGEVRGLGLLYAKYASLPWSRLLAPAIGFARDGFTVKQDLVTHIDHLDDAEELFTSPTWALDFAPNGTRLGLDDVLKRSRYAATLQTISDEGPDAFYSGPIAESMVKAVGAAGGIMTLDDLRDYQPVQREAWAIDYGEYRIHGCGLPSGGVVALNILSVLKGYGGVGDASNVKLTTHRLDEAMRFGYGLRTELGDPDFDMRLESYQQMMQSKSTTSAIRSLISDDHTQPLSVYNPKGLEVITTHGTSHLSVADSSGLAISLTSTINLPFGSHLMDPETGIILNNEMNDFSIPKSTDIFGEKPSSANYPKPGKRPLSSMNPILVDFAANGTFYAALGAQGSERIITSVVQALWYLLDRKMGLLEALRAPRLHEQLSPNQTSYEWEYGNSTVAFMEERGHITAWLQDGSSVQAVRRLPNGTFEAAGEPRQRDSGGFAV